MPRGETMAGSREESLARLRIALAEARSGRARAVLVRGDIGMGKSWLLEQIALEIASSGADVCVLRATGHPTETELPFAGLHQLIAPLLSRLPELPAAQANALAGALALGESKAGDRLAASAGLLGLLTLESERRPVVVVVDDLHWMDVSTRHALTFVARRIQADAVLLLAAARPEVGVESADAGFERLFLAPLDEGDSRALLSARFPDLGAPAAGRILTHAAGLPLALLQIPADLSDAERAGTAPLPEPLPLGDRLDEFYGARMQKLGTAGRHALATAGLEELTRAQLGAALADLALSMEHIEPAEQAGLVRMGSDGVAFTHPTVRSAALGAITGAEIRRSREAIMRALPAGSPRIAAHLDALATGPDEATAAALDAAAADAWGRSAYDEAARSWRAAAARSVDPRKAGTRRGRAVQAYARCGAWAAVGSLVDRLVADAADDRELAEWQRLALVAALYSDSTPPARSVIEALGDSLLPESPREVAQLLTTFAFVSFLMGRLREASAIADRVRTLLPGGLTLTERLVLDDIDLAIGRVGGGALLVTDWDSQVTDDELCDPGAPMSPIVAHMVWIGDVDHAHRIVERQRAALERRAGVSLMDLCLAQRASIMVALGRWDEAHSDFTSAADLSRASDFAASLPHIALRHAYLLAARGREAEVREILAGIDRRSVASHSLHGHLVLCVEGLLALSLGRADDAVRHLSAAGVLEREMGMIEPAFSSRVGDLFDALWRLRRHDEALAELAPYDLLAQQVGRRSAQAVSLRCRGLAVEAERVDATFAAALTLHGSEHGAFETARTELAWGQRLRRDRRKADARAPLHRALAAFDALGAVPWSAVALAELAACGERHARVAASDPVGELTPRELEVAVAVAGGASNAEVAARLFVSKRTVEYHLGAVYRKLEIAHRGELAGALRR